MPEPAPPVPAKRRRRVPRALLSACEYLEAILVAVLLAVFTRAFVFQAFEIPSGSMEETLLVGDHVLVNKFVHARATGPWRAILPYAEVETGEVIVFRSPERPDLDLVKRVVGRSGDTLRIEGRSLIRNGRKVEEPWALFRDPPPPGPWLAAPERPREGMPERRVPAGSVFVMGDNRDDSRDSRTWGPVPQSLVRGRTVLVYWSRAEPGGGPPRTAGPSRHLDAALDFLSRTRWSRSFRLVR